MKTLITKYCKHILISLIISFVAITSYYKSDNQNIPEDFIKHENEQINEELLSNSNSIQHKQNEINMIDKEIEVLKKDEQNNSKYIDNVLDKYNQYKSLH